MAKAKAKAKESKVPKDPSVSSLIGKKLVEAGNDDNGFHLYFAGGYKLEIRGGLLLVVKKEDTA